VFWFEKLKERHCLGNKVMKVRIILKWILKKYDQGRLMLIGAEQEQEYSAVKNVLQIWSPSNG
jgi:hypothetical protein